MTDLLLTLQRRKRVRDVHRAAWQRAAVAAFD
jgi:hypothetical protein